MIILAATIGFFSSLLSSIFGGGFGLLSVPGFYILFSKYYHFHGNTMQVVIATAATCSIPLGITASLKQKKLGNIDYLLCKKVLIIMCIGGLLGAYAVHIVDSNVIKKLFSVVVFIAALFMFFYKPKDSSKINYFILQTFSLPIAFISNLVAVSVFTVPFFVLNSIDIKKAIGTSTFIVFCYSILGAIVLVCSGISNYGISWSQIGYLPTPVFLVAVIPCIIGAILGVKLVNILPKIVLHYIFISLMLVIAVLMY
jgi:uncharacterized membrane protein YfcA